MRWHADASAFEKECVGYPGFVTKFRISNQVSDDEIKNKFQKSKLQKHCNLLRINLVPHSVQPMIVLDMKTFVMFAINGIIK